MPHILCRITLITSHDRVRHRHHWRRYQRHPAGRGLRVLLVEMNDLASGTSSASSKLIHGGLRYLEKRAFRLVREALGEREVLLRMAPHVIRPMRFMLPPMPGMRSPLLLRFGLFLYDI